MNTNPNSSMPRPRRMVLAGGSGFLGQVLADYFAGRGWDITVLTRAPGRSGATCRDSIHEEHWDGANPGAWCRCLDGAEVLINLAGVSVNCRYHARNRRRLIESRVLPTRALGRAAAACGLPPRVWLNASTATLYKHNFGPAWDESGEIGAHPDAKDAFSIEIATAWEREFDAAPAPGARKIALRSAMVLGLGSNSVYPTLRRLVRLGLGGRMGDGRQFVSWIHEHDFCRAIEWLIEKSDADGVFNLAAPNPVTNAEMMSTLRALCGRRLGLPASKWMLEVGAFLLRTETELIIKSRRVVSRRLANGGFKFGFPTLRQAIEELMNR